MRSIRVTACLALALAATAAAQEAPRPGELRLEPCDRAGIQPPARCGTFTVWENRDAEAGRTIDLNVILLEATGGAPEPDAIVFLAGGPGQPATTAARGLSQAPIREARDILLVDQRGTGESNGLYCGPEDTAPLQAFMAILDPERMRACREELEARADLRYYLTTHAMDDLDELRAALGYERINLYGSSYGTRAALVYLRRHGESVRSAILMGATAMSHPMPTRFATDAEAALGNVLRDCAADPSCAAAFPDLEADYRRAIRLIEERPATVQIRDPRTGDTVGLAFRAADFAESLRAMLYGTQTTRYIPALLHHVATTGDYRPFAEQQLQRNVGLFRGVAQGMCFAVTCTEDVARVDPDAVYAAGHGTFLADHRARPHIEGCDGWPLGALPAGYGDEVESDVPVLIITGANDPATPPASAHAAASRLSTARVIIVPEGGHGLAGLEGIECTRELEMRFLETADPGALDTACVTHMRRPPFILTPDR